MTCTRTALPKADRAALVADVAAAVRAGGLCVLPTETVYGLAVWPGDPAAVERARALKGRDKEQHFTWHLADRTDLPAIAADGDVRAERLLDRYWPGPLTLVLPGKDGGTVGVRLPAHEFTRAVLRATGPLWLSSVNRSGEPPLCDPAVIERQFGHALRFLIDDGPSPLGVASTVVRCTGPRLEVLREGILSPSEVLHTAAATVLFVCTGNTCRSPMAEVLARDLLARKLGVPAAELLARGIAFASAGTGTMDDMPASEGSVLAAQEIDLDLGGHRSRVLTRELLARAARVYCLAASHQRAVLTLAPEAAARTELLQPDGKDIKDPYGGELDDYRAARDEIAAAIKQRLRQWRALLPAG